MRKYVLTFKNSIWLYGLRIVVYNQTLNYAGKKITLGKGIYFYSFGLPKTSKIIDIGGGDSTVFTSLIQHYCVQKKVGRTKPKGKIDSV